MKITTSNPIIFKGVRKESNCSGIDGSNSTSVREFQVWASINHAAQLVADGIYGPLTKAAYAKWGDEWEKTQTPTTTSPTTKTRAGVVTANQDNTNVYDLNNKIVKVASKGEYVGTIQGDAGDGFYYVNTSWGKGKVVKLKVDVAKGDVIPPSPTPTKPNEVVIAPVTAPVGIVDKIKSLSMPAKIGIGIGVAVVLGIVIWKLIPKKK